MSEDEKEERPWYAFRYGERALPDRGGDHLRNWELDMSPEAVERRERIGKIMREQHDEHMKEIKELLRKKKEENKLHE